MRRMIENIWFKILSGDARWRIEYDQLQRTKIDWIELKFKTGAKKTTRIKNALHVSQRYARDGQQTTRNNHSMAISST